MRADILTKGFLDTEKWAHALMLINHVDPKTFWTFFPNREIITIRCNDAPKAGGITKDLAEVAAPAEAPNPRQIAAGEVFALPKRARRQIHRLISKVAWPKGGRVNDSSSSLSLWRQE